MNLRRIKARAVARNLNPSKYWPFRGRGHKGAVFLGGTFVGFGRVRITLNQSPSAQALAMAELRERRAARLKVALTDIDAGNLRAVLFGA